MRSESRRRFLGRMMAAAGASAAPYLVRSSALGAGRAVPPSDRIVMGAIGVGGRGTYDMGALMGNKDVQMVAVCDVQGDRRAAAKAAVDKHYGNQDCAAYVDLRDVLARDDIDAVLIATGDNWHSLAAVLAAQAGKDTYCEKPLSVTIRESRAVVDAVRRRAVVFQCGTQRRTVTRFQFAADLARSGALGKLHTLTAEKSPDWFGGWHERALPPAKQPPRDVLDWNQWLGPAPWRAFNKEYMARNFWGGHRDFGGGPVTEWGSHTADLCQWANNADDTSPLEFWQENGTIVGRYANGVRLVFVEGKWPLHVKFEGTDGWVYVDDDGNIETHPASLRTDRNFGKGYPAEGHVRQFLDCVKSRARPVSTPEASHRSITACHCANICLRLGRKVTWDPVREEFPGDDEANRYVLRAYREPWRL